MKTFDAALAEAPGMYKAEAGLGQNRRPELHALMNQRLADAVDLQMQMKQAHWNVKGPSLVGLRELFDKVSRSVESYVDLIAERIVQLGGIAEGTVRMSVARSLLEEYPLTISEGEAHVEAVIKALSTFSHHVRITVNETMRLNDTDSAVLFTRISRGIDQWRGFIETHCQATN